MAKKDFDRYYSIMLLQHMQMVEDEEDFKEALKAGKITKEHFDELHEEFLNYDQNFQRLQSIKVMLDEPQRKSKKNNYRRAFAKTLKQLDDNKNDVISVAEESIKNTEVFNEKAENLPK